jgi:hypothetical protein
MTMLRARQLFLRRGETLLAGLAAWILVYWLATATNASFDVYIEGPQGGIWFWSLMGAGIALSMLAGSDQAPGDVNTVNSRLPQQARSSGAGLPAR